MKKSLIVLFVFFVHIIQVSAQQFPLGKYTFSVQPLQLFFQEIPISFERSFGRNTLGILAAYRFKTKWDQNQNMPYYNFNEHMMPTQYSISNFQAITIGLNAKHYFTKHPKMFIEAQLFYRYWWEKKEYFLHLKGYEHFTLNDRIDIVGVKFLYGHTSVYRANKKCKFILHKYIGLSWRYRIMQTHMQSRTVNGNTEYFSYASERGEPGHALGFQLGLNFGLSMNPRETIVK